MQPACPATMDIAVTLPFLDDLGCFSCFRSVVRSLTRKLRMTSQHDAFDAHVVTCMYSFCKHACRADVVPAPHGWQAEAAERRGNLQDERARKALCLDAVAAGESGKAMPCASLSWWFQYVPRCLASGASHIIR